MIIHTIMTVYRYESRAGASGQAGQANDGLTFLYLQHSVLVRVLFRLGHAVVSAVIT